MMAARMLARIAPVVVGLTLLGGAPALARESSGTAAAKARFAEGEAAVKAGKLDAAVAAFRKAIDADPDYVDAHQRYIDLTRRIADPANRSAANPKLQRQYELWARLHPKRAVYPWALGVLTDDAAAADAYFRKAVTIDPSFARAYFLLARNADQRGDFAAQRDDLRKASEANPGDPRYLVSYAWSLRRGEPDRFRTLALEVIAKFPASQQAAQALYNLADQSSNPERRAYLNRLRAEYPADRFSYSSSAMIDLYGELVEPADALALALEMARALPASRTWPQRAAQQEAMVRAQALLADGRFADALAALGAQRPSGVHGVTWTLLEADAAAGAGHADDACAALVDALTIAPDERLESALQKHGATLGRSRAQIDADIWRARDAKAKTAPLFELPSSRDGSPVKLSDYRGQLVLLTFWFPG
jgi:tetratricopeptide (TPR) repeat protein